MILRALKASHGDSLLLLGEGVNVLIDGGPSGAYNRVLRNQLSELKSKDGGPANLDLVVVSHIDADHIDGVLDLTASLIESGDDFDPVVHIDRVWHNSFTDLIPEGNEDLQDSAPSSIASLASMFEEYAVALSRPGDSTLVLSSVEQGRRLSLDLKKLTIDLNRGFTNKVVLAGNAKGPYTRGELTLTVIGPTQVELDDLQDKWAKELPRILAKEAAASPQALRRLDHSISNLASIVVVAEAAGKTALLTGDSRGDLIVEWLETAGVLESGGSVTFDVVKLPHHGATANVSPEFFRRIRAEHYLISGNGGSGNPEPEVLEMLFDERPELDYQVHMTYGPKELKAKKAFQDAGNVSKLDAVLADPARVDVLRFPEPGGAHIDIEF